MKKLYILMLFSAVISTSILNAQTTLITDDFETGYTNGTEISTTDASWVTFGTGFTFPATNVSSGGAESSDWYVRMERGGTANFAAAQRVFALTAGETYEFKASVLPDLAGQKNAYTLRVLDGTTVVAESAFPATGTAWEELSVTYVAAATQNYTFRVNKNWGTAGASFDNFSVVCTTCTPLSVIEKDGFEFSMYPNPVKDMIYFNSQEALTSVKAYSLLGKELLNIQHPIEHINVSALNTGTYVLKLEAENGSTVTRKFLKE